MSENPKLESIVEDGNKLEFTLKNVDVSFANAIRRTILSSIPVVVFKTEQHELKSCNIHFNNTKFNNEIIKQRLGCIPIHADPDKWDYSNHVMILDVQNNTEDIIIITTENFQIINKKTGNYIDEEELRLIFPSYDIPNSTESYFIDFIRLMPKACNEINSESIKISCVFDVSCAKESSMYNVVGTCSYGFTPDKVKMNEELDKLVEIWKEELNEEELRFEKKNWALLDGLRYVIKNSFDFIIETIGIYDNYYIIKKSIDIIVAKLNNIKEMSEDNRLEINKSDNTLKNSFDVVLYNEDYTIGNILNHILYEKYYLGANILSYVGFKKIHPHDNFSILRCAFIETADKSSLKEILLLTIEESILILRQIQNLFM